MPKWPKGVKCLYCGVAHKTASQVYKLTQLEPVHIIINRRARLQPPRYKQGSRLLLKPLQGLSNPDNLPPADELIICPKAYSLPGLLAAPEEQHQEGGAVVGDAASVPIPSSVAASRHEPVITRSAVLAEALRLQE